MTAVSVGMKSNQNDIRDPCFNSIFTNDSLCGKSQNTAPLAAVMNGKQGFGGATPMMLFPLKDTPLLAAGFFIEVSNRYVVGAIQVLRQQT